MSDESVQLIIGRAVTDPEFCELLFNAPEEAVSGYDLTDQELSALKNVTREHFDSVRSELEERLSKAGFSAASFAQLSGKWGGPNLRAAIFTKRDFFTPTDNF